jgi:hypothetical protein
VAAGWDAICCMSQSITLLDKISNFYFSARVTDGSIASD